MRFGTRRIEPREVRLAGGAPREDSPVRSDCEGVVVSCSDLTNGRTERHTHWQLLKFGGGRPTERTVPTRAEAEEIAALGQNERVVAAGGDGARDLAARQWHDTWRASLRLVSQP